MSRKLTFIVSVLLVALAGCQKDGTVSLVPRSDYVGPESGDIFVKVAASGDWTLSLEFPSGAESWARVSPSEGSGEQNNVHFKYGANQTEQSREVTLVLSAGGSSARATITQGPKTAPVVIGNYGYDVATMDWLELPASVKSDGREVLVHSMDGGKYKDQSTSGIRNWSCYWDYKEHMALWVAYPHNNGLRGSGSRSDQWGVYDPCIPKDLQPDLSNTYGGGWTRGHQIPSADRYVRAANISTFYPTNMTPQAYNFNGKIWANLEGKVRNYASQADTLYVVTGALFDNSTRVSGSSSGFMVKIPTHYFKALLYRGSSAYAQSTNGYMMCGFYLPHDDGIANENCLSYRVSIDRLEELTGIDFFPNLERRDKALAKQLEAAAPNASFWN